MRISRLSLAALAVSVVSFFALAASPAFAVRSRALKETIGASGSGAGELALRAAGVGVGGSGVEVNRETHDIYVADTGNRRVDEFDPFKPAAEQFVRAWGWGVENGEAKFETCTTVTTCRAGLSGSGVGEFEAPTFIAVDNAPGGEGDVYVADTGDDTIAKFTAEGALVRSSF
jgi:DNA-binding beta-propeller fold protein YncE